jgi:hypothetical protein
MSFFLLSLPYSVLLWFYHQNRMQEALTLFDSICNSRWFVKTSIVSLAHLIPRFNPLTLAADSLPKQNRSVRRETPHLTDG